jgi:hypothetical protein
MRLFSRRTVVETSGLTSGQVDQLISRWGVEPDGPRVGATRLFYETDLFVFIVAGELARLGLDQKSIAHAVHSLPLLPRDPESFAPQATYANPGQAICLVFLPRGDSKEFSATGHFVPKDVVGQVFGAFASCGAIVLDAGAIAARIEQAPDVDPA